MDSRRTRVESHSLPTSTPTVFLCVFIMKTKYNVLSPFCQLSHNMALKKSWALWVTVGEFCSGLLLQFEPLHIIDNLSNVCQNLEK